VTTHALPLRARLAGERERVLVQPVLDGLFFATVVTVTFHKLQWELAGSLTLSDVLTSVFLVLFAWDRIERSDTRLTRTSVVALGFFLAFALVYLAGFYNLDTGQALAQWSKGMVKFVLHFGFLVTGVALLARRPLAFYWLALGAFCGGIALNALYGVIQLVLAEVAGTNLDSALIEPITSRQTGINVFGAVGGTQEVFRPNALTGDPNHLGIELVIPLLVLTPLYLRLEPGHRWRLPLAALLVFMLVVELATLSRSGLLGLGCGALVLALPYRRHLRRPAFLIPLGAVAAVVAAVVVARLDFFLTVLRARTNTSRAAASPHFEVYEFIPDVLSTNPLLGLGLNNFAVYYEFVTGRPDFGPHSFYVATLVETGLVGAALFGVFVWWIFRRLGAARALGRALAAVGDPLSARVRPLAWGMTAALVATLVANLFYLTMTFYYFYVFAVLAVALPVVFGRAARAPA
jgi:O-antigen ligase